MIPAVAAVLVITALFLVAWLLSSCALGHHFVDRDGFGVYFPRDAGKRVCCSRCRKFGVVESVEFGVVRVKLEAPE